MARSWCVWRAWLRENGSRVLFSVRDTGIGIPADRMDRLFRSFSQVDASITRRYGGTGLGLAISKRLVELMGGSLWAESAPGAGATFHFTITAPAAPEPDGIQDAGAVLAGRPLLIVDDNPTIRMFLAELTQRWGMAPTAVASGLEALALFAKGVHFAAVLLDAQMPAMTGYDLAVAIRQLTPAVTAAAGHVNRAGRRAASGCQRACGCFPDETRKAAAIARDFGATAPAGERYETVFGVGFCCSGNRPPGAGFEGLAG